MLMMVHTYQFNKTTPNNNNIFIYTKLLYQDSSFHPGKSFDHDTRKLRIERRRNTFFVFFQQNFLLFIFSNLHHGFLSFAMGLYYIGCKLVMLLQGKGFGIACEIHFGFLIARLKYLNDLVHERCSCHNIPQVFTKLLFSKCFNFICFQ